MITQAKKSLGLTGRPNYITKWYAARNGSFFADAPWCQMAISYWAFHSGNYDAVCFGKDYAYTVWSAQEFQKRGRWGVDTAGITPGAIAFFDWAGTNNIGAIDHVGLVVAVNGRDITVLEGNTSDSCKLRIRHADTIVGYGRPAYVTATPTPTAGTYTVKAGDTLSAIGRTLGVDWTDLAAANGIKSPYVINIGQVLKVPGATTPPPAPPKPPEPPVYTPPPFPAGLKPGSASPSAKPLQKALKAAKYMASSVTLADNYGPLTQAAVKKFHAANPAYGTGSDPAIGPLGWAHLHTEAYGNVTAPPAPPADDEPAHDYKRVTYTGKTINVRTKVMLERAVKLLTAYDWTPALTQGSYNKGVGASAGTHDGGGVVDIRTNTMSRNGADICVQALRKAGFAAWRRGDGDGMSPHIHAVAIGDRELSSSAKSQIVQWRNDTNGLANRGPDPAADPYPLWTRKYR